MKKIARFGRNQWKVTLLNLGVILVIMLILAVVSYFAYPYIKPAVDDFVAKREAAKLEETSGEGENGGEFSGAQTSLPVIQSGENQAQGQSAEGNPAEGESGETGQWEDLGEGDREEPEEEKNHRYEFVPSDGTWEDALRAAQEAGGYLATITSPEEEHELEQLMETHEGYYVVWLGANCLSGEYAWVNGEAWEYDNWAEGEPNNETGSESYLLMYRVKKVWCWNDAEVSVSEYYKGHMGYIVEYEE